MPINKVVYGGRTLIDLSNDTVDANTLSAGTTAHDKSGNQIVGEMTSGAPNGTKWEASNQSVFYLTGIAKLNKTWIVGTLQQKPGAYWSEDGATWFPASGFIKTDQVAMVAAADGIAISSGSRSGLHWSTDGKTWSRSNMKAGRGNFAVHEEGIWVTAVGSNGLLWSVDGKTWNNSNVTTGSYSYAVYGGGKWIAVSDDATKISDDGKVWSDSAPPEAFVAIGYYSGKWVGCSYTYAGLYFSNDGVNWTQSNVSDGDFSFVVNVNGIWQAFGYPYYAVSEDGEVWTTQENSVEFNDLKYANGIYIGCGTGTGMSWSVDGLNWNNSNITTLDYMKVEYSDGLWVCGGKDKILYSKSWEPPNA